MSLVILVLLSAIAVALLQSSGVDRGSAKAVADKSKADLAAQTAANAAIALLLDTLTKYPDAATGWETINGNEGTVLYYRDQTPEQAINSGNAAQLYAVPLASGAIAQTFPNRATALPLLTDSPPSTANAYNFNRPRTKNDVIGWIGSAPSWTASSPTTPQPFRGQWINMINSDNKVTARYAFWMEDDSFKANANLMGVTPRGSNTLGESAAQIPFQGVLKPVLGSSVDADGIANNIITYRSKYPNGYFFDFTELNQAGSQTSLADTLKFESSLYTGALNLSRSGARRVNLNKVVQTSTDPTEIRKQLDEIIKTITYQLPNFAQRFYRTDANLNNLEVAGSGSPSDRTIYLNKVAANMRDYIDTDSQPTIVNRDLSINAGAVATHSLPGGGNFGANEVIAIGKDAVPSIQEYMVRVKMDDFSNRLGASANYKLEIDHYVEVWNMTNKDIEIGSLGGHPFFRIANQFGWDAGGANDIPEGASRDFSIPLGSFTNSSGAQLSFPAGTVTVLTTDPAPLPSTFPGIDPSRIFRPATGVLADASRIYQGTTKKKSGSNLRIDSIPRPVNSSTSADLETEVILGNDNGVLESFGAPSVYYMTINVDDGTSSANSVHSDIKQYYFRASSLKGNVASAIASQVGDPRTNNEQLTTTSSTSNDDQTAYKLEAWNSPTQISNTTFTKLDTNYVNPSTWVDVAANTTDAPHAPAVVANTTMTSIGELGDVFDPARALGATPTGSGDIHYSRGGGRTLKIGQPDDLWDGNSNSASREWTAWRLADIFTTNDFIPLDARININGVARDGGTAFRAALYGYAFRAAPSSDPALATQSLTDSQVDLLVSQIKDRLDYKPPFDQASGPFAEFGELSEMRFFKASNTGTGPNMSVAYDRGREEIFRRLTELITTRGNVFTVYAVGQSVAAGATPTVVTSTAQLKVTFRIDPVWNAGQPSDPFDPNNVNTRFAKPDKYDIKILYAGD